jgi:outer membrane protein OmpA-like peptidoglycan-associated protein
MDSHLTNLIKNHVGRILTGGVLASALVACAGNNVTPQLADARDAYDRAEDSPAARRNPAELERARIALERAEDAHDEDPGSAREAQLARRAESRAQAAMSHAPTTAAERAEYRDRTRAERAEVRAEAAEDRAELRAERAEVRADRAEVRDDDRYDRTADARPMIKAESKKAAAALQNLGPVAAVKEEPRGVVITLSGSLLFPTGQEEMSPIARQNLDQVAHALAQQPKDSTFQVEGHTDNSGPDSQNAKLAEERAKAVADHLVQAGIDPDRIRVVGMGESRPIANNETDEGRAANRRVEIVVADRG